MAEPAQADYECLRQAALEGARVCSVSSARFERRGLSGLIAWPSAEPVLVATVLGADRPPWSGRADPRLAALAAGYEWILSAGSGVAIPKEAQL